MITLDNLTLQRGTKLLFANVSVTIFAQQKIGIVGMNGCGKSSLFALLLKQLTPDAGDLKIQPKIRIAHLAQTAPTSDLSALQYTMLGDEDITALKQKVKNAEIKNNHILSAQLYDQLHTLGGYALEAKAAKILSGLGFSHSEQQQAVNTFSGGWRMRLNLAQILLSRADLLLLDEPTNYLDLDAMVWLEEWLRDYSSTLLVISHDREFLDNVIDRIIYIHHQTLAAYIGNYSSFEEQRAQQLTLEKSHYQKQQAKIEHLTKYINRFRAKATKARQAQSRLKILEKMERVVLTHQESPFDFKFLAAKPCPSPLLRLTEVNFSYAKHEVLHDINFNLDTDARIGILGVNGAGKTTFMKLLAGKLQPTLGTITANKGLNIGYFAQYQVEQLNLKTSALDHILALDPKIPATKIRTFLGGFKFSGDMALGKIENFSGGEKARLVLAMLIWQKPNLLLLDEPTNHLDLEMREALALALQEYTGTLVLVAHDRHLLKATVDEFYLVNEHQVTKFDGDLTDYQKWLLNLRKVDKVNPAFQPKNLKSQTINNSKHLQKLEKKLAQLYAKKEQLTQSLSDTTLYQCEKKAELEKYLHQSTQLEKEISLIEQEWYQQQ